MEKVRLVVCAFLALCLTPVIVAENGGLVNRHRGGESGCVGGNCGRGITSGKDRAWARLLSPRVRRQTVIVVEEEQGRGGSHKLPCTRAEMRQTACLNGECYALDLAGYRNPFCHCPAMWEGTRCEQLSTYYFMTRSAELRKAAIIGGVVVGIIIIIVAASIYCSYRKGRRKRKANAKQNEEKQETDAMVTTPDGESQV